MEDIVYMKFTMCVLFSILLCLECLGGEFDEILYRIEFRQC